MEANAWFLTLEIHHGTNYKTKDTKKALSGNVVRLAEREIPYTFVFPSTRVSRSDPPPEGCHDFIWGSLAKKIESKGPWNGFELAEKLMVNTWVLLYLATVT